MELIRENMELQKVMIVGETEKLPHTPTYHLLNSFYAILIDCYLLFCPRILLFTIVVIVQGIAPFILHIIM